MSRHHVLHAAAVMPSLPPVLAKSLMLLATYADHRTGIARPGRTVITQTWGVPYSTWFRHIRQLEGLGLVKQIAHGNDKAGRAAEYRLLYVEPYATSGTPTRSGKGGLRSVQKTPSLTGGDAIGENQPGVHPQLTPHEEREWNRIRARVLNALSPDDRGRLQGAGPGFDQLTALKRTTLRLADRAGDAVVVEELTRQPRAGQPAYAGARDILPAMWSRLDKLARTWGVDILEDTPVEASPDLEATLASLGVRLPTGPAGVGGTPRQPRQPKAGG